MRYILITDKEELIKYKEKIFNLYFNCWKKEMCHDYWNWFYIDNPCGSPIVSLVFDDNLLVSHYAVIPLCSKLDDTKLNSYLSADTLTHTEYRGRGLFTIQAKMTFLLLKDILKADIVFGFPNKNSVNGFRKRLGWTILPPDYLVDLRKEDTNELVKYGGFLMNKKNKLKINPSIIKWRLSKPNIVYSLSNNILSKNYIDKISILSINWEFYCESDIYNKLNSNEKYNILINGDFGGFHNNTKNEYLFGYLWLNKNLGEIGSKSLLLSDVF